MYGEPHDSISSQISLDAPIAVVVGGAKVPSDIYKLADYNVGIGNQPHSEVAALALFMNELMGEVAGQEHFKGARLEIEPHASGKVVIDHSEGSPTSE